MKASDTLKRMKEQYGGTKELDKAREERKAESGLDEIRAARRVTLQKQAQQVEKKRPVKRTELSTPPPTLAQ